MVLANKLRIEFATLSDTTEISKLSRDEIEHGLGWKYTTNRLARLLKSDSKNVVVARIYGELAGFGIMSYYQEQANLDLLAVKTSFRRSHIATSIVQWLEDVAMTAGIHTVFVQVRQSNKGAITFYQRTGYLEIDCIPQYYNGIENAVIMAKQLRPLTHTTS